MRTMLTVQLPVQAGNRAIKDGSLPRVIQRTLEAIKPESAYFYTENGKRTMRAVFDMPSQAQMVPMLEPLFLELEAELTLTPVMNAEELEGGFKMLQM